MGEGFDKECFEKITFVRSDSPLEPKRLADAELGKGFAVRAVDNSNIVPLLSVDSGGRAFEGKPHPRAKWNDLFWS
jgi:hypothetical protein